MKNKFETINLNQLLLALKSRILPIVLCTVIVAAGALFYYSQIVPEQYTATVSIIVDNRSTNDVTADPEASQIKSTSDITASRMLTDTYIAIFNNSSFLESVAGRVNQSSELITSGSHAPLTGKQLCDMLTMSSVNSTELLQIKAASRAPQLSVDICYAIVAEAQEVLRNTMNTLTVNSVEGDNILLPTDPSSPNVIVQTLIATLLALCICCAVVLVIFVVDDTIKATDDLSDICGYPILGEIPSIKKSEVPQGIRRIRK